MTINKNSKFILLFVIFSLMIMGQVSLDIYLPAMPGMLKYFNTSSMLIQLSITFMLATFSLCQLVMAMLVKRFGKKRLLLIGILLLTFSNIICAMTSSILWFLIMRLLTGVGAGCCNVLARTELIDSFEGHEFKRYSSFLYLSWALVPMIAPLIGGYINHYLNWQAIFWLLSLIGVLMFFFIACCYIPRREISARFDMQQAINSYRELIAGDGKYFMHLILCVVLSFSTLITLVQCLPFYLHSVQHFNSLQIGHTLFIIGLATILGVYINLALLKITKLDYVVYIGLLLMSILSILMLRLDDVFVSRTGIIVLIAGFFVIRVGVALVLPNVQSVAMSLRKDLSSYASALLGFMTYIGSMVISYAVSHLPHTSVWPLLAALMVECVMCLTVYLLRPNTPAITPRSSQA